MAVKTKFFLFVMVLQWPPSLLFPLVRRDVASNPNKSVLETDQVEGITPNNSKVTELMQQIDVKDNENKVISNIKNVDVLGNYNELNDRTPRPALSKNGENLNINSSSNLKKSITIGVDNNDKLTPIIDNAFSHESSHFDNITFANTEATVELISSAEAPVFRSLIPENKRKRQQLPKDVSTTVEPETTEDYNLVIKLTPDSQPITIDLNRLPLNHLLGNALSFIKRFKRNTLEVDTDITSREKNCKSAPVDEGDGVKSCNKAIPDNGSNTTLLNTTIKSLQDSNFDVQDDTVELVCPLSVIVKLYRNQIFNKLIKDNLHDILNQILNSIMKGDKNAITVVSKELAELPLKLKLRLQLVHGETKEFMEQLSNIVDATLCSIS